MTITTSPVRRTVRAALSLTAGITLAAAMTACASGPAESGSNGGDADQGQVVYLSSQPAGDSGSIDDMVAGLKQVGEQEDVDTKYLEVTDPSAFESSLRNAAQSGASVIVTAFPDLTDAITQVAPDFPDTEFVHIFAAEREEPLDNVTTLGFEIHEAFYIAGFSAAKLSQSGVVGWVGGDSSPILSANFHAFEAGAKAANPAAQVLSGVVGSFSDPSKGRDIALGMISQGADVIQTDASGSSLGVIEAAQQRGALVFADASGEVAAEYPETVVGTSFLRFGQALVDAVTEALEDGYTAGHKQVGLDAGVVGLQFADSFLAGSSPRVADVPSVQAEALQQKIIAGEVEVIFDPSSI
ncbi:BMP family ABC transporter substrate-binding protein [Ruicaihuangia caeni]|uniref:BMP family ABC transporter substrate-binding protein n=1 Tax=Ruicaihuangia caeni TaxID=3042517 RepID=A0AAW6TA65_9MICO|nr:BMP family ABC transporter substrate-binding protein [Klugiella sp. YN-L-19]MDI2098487.1 BMP family ABC transporter substrate-binding protein [Klugiella sp. YN-L-19]